MLLISESIILSDGGAFTVTIGCLQEMNKASNLDVCVDSLVSTLSSSNRLAVDLKSLLAAKTSELDRRAPEINERCFSFAEDTIRLTQEQVQRHGL